MNLKILYEDNHVIAVDKIAGMLTQGDYTGDISLYECVKEYLKIKYRKPGNVFLGIVQRLDKQVSGVLMFARTSKAARILNGEFLSRKVTKIYLAIVPMEGETPGRDWLRLEQNILRKRDVSEISPVESGRTKKAALICKEILSVNGYRLLMIGLYTGRKHQIRTQLSSIGIPVIGDTKYGSGEKVEDGSICLHSFYLKIAHPIKKNDIELVSPPPETFSKRIARIDDIMELLINNAREAPGKS
ncbi:MAG: RluA family pseudouridine synthase [Spirochaetes bacterium]|jgi:23S rRNA pseudouridine1911/1915/1917 synthase|nr:RluA family pseudouridine synthase [Spirochaetota bacterium]